MSTTVINTTPVDESMSFETKQYVCVRKLLTNYHFGQLLYMQLLDVNAGLDWDKKKSYTFVTA